MMTRYALVALRGTTVTAIQRYLPNNYEVWGEWRDALAPAVLIVGTDVAGWTLDGYVLPRLASGLIAAEEIAADHSAVTNAATKYRVVENTPGYLPEDEPVDFYVLSEAQEYARERAELCGDALMECVPGSQCGHVEESPTLWRITNDQPNSLDRVVEIIEVRP